MKWRREILHRAAEELAIITNAVRRTLFGSLARM